ncbi:MAG: glutathione S-transferase family protein [Chromatiales bacterium]|jgi:glutathione S-transferase|nr:glutathione S-transferase family protein [Chromatiales bacterium]
MKLYMVPLAPNPTKVMLYIAEREHRGTGLGIEQIVVNTVKGRHKEPEHLARNPFGTLPVLELEDEDFLIESLTIIEYLEALFPDGALLPKDPRARAQALEIERIVELRAATHMGRYAHATKSPLGRPADPVVATEAEANLQPAFDYLEDTLADERPFLTGNAPSIADFSLQAACQFLRFIESDIFGDRPGLRAWDTRFRATPAALAVLKW